MTMIRWANHEKWLARLQKLAPSAEKHLAVANEKSAQEMAMMARTLVPKRTGKLAASIVVTPAGGIPPAYSQGARAVPEGAVAVSAGNSNVRYAHLVEYGTKPHENEGIFPGTLHPGTAKHPFFWPAYRATRKRHRGRITRAFSQSIKATKTP